MPSTVRSTKNVDTLIEISLFVACAILVHGYAQVYEELKKEITKLKTKQQESYDTRRSTKDYG